MAHMPQLIHHMRGNSMTYYVVRVQDSSGEIHSLVFALRRDQNLMEQVHEKVGLTFVVLSVNLLGVVWP